MANRSIAAAPVMVPLIWRIIALVVVLLSAASATQIFDWEQVAFAALGAGILGVLGWDDPRSASQASSLRAAKIG